MDPTKSNTRAQTKTLFGCSGTNSIATDSPYARCSFTSTLMVREDMRSNQTGKIIFKGPVTPNIIEVSHLHFPRKNTCASRISFENIRRTNSTVCRPLTQSSNDMDRLFSLLVSSVSEKKRKHQWQPELQVSRLEICNPPFGEGTVCVPRQETFRDFSGDTPGTEPTTST